MKLMLCTAAMLALSAHAQDFSASRADSGRDAPNYVLGSAHERWADGQVPWYYNPANQPANLSTADVLAAINTATARWAGMCNLSFNYQGLTTAAPNMRSSLSTIDHVSVIGWGELTDEMAIYGAYTKWWYDSSHAMMDADIMVNTARQWTLQNVEAIMTHELGHFIGLQHSNVQASVMFANPYNSYSYQRTLRGDDANACAALYGASANAQTNRALNWAEQAYPQLFATSPAPSATYNGYYYRFYPGTGNYIAGKNGEAFMMGPNNVILDLGPLDAYSGTVQGAGF